MALRNLLSAFILHQLELSLSFTFELFHSFFEFVMESLDLSFDNLYFLILFFSVELIGFRLFSMALVFLLF